ILRSQACLVSSRKTRAAADEAVLRDIAAKMASVA
ncbi:MAG: ATP phosphoribosyltransferase catalytic subunit HisG, partial [Mesorhizobium sp.]